MKEKIAKIKEFYENNKQKVTLFGSIAFVMLLIIITIAIVVKLVGTKMSYEKLEDTIENATKEYLSENPSELPNEVKPTVVISANTLIEQKYLKELKKYVKDSSCTANVLVDYENNSYKYQAYLTCNKFKTEKFIDVIKNNNKISQTGEGLYEMNNELVFRGQNPNNFIMFADRLWRIVKINKEGAIHIIVTTDKADINDEWDNRYNTEKGTQRGINNFLLSRAFNNIKNFYDNNLSDYETFLTKYDLCVGKRLEESTDKSGSLECNEKIEQQKIGLLPVYDYMNASLDGLCQTTISKECQNYNYLTDNKFKWWTMTADMKTTFDVFYVNAKGQVVSDYASANSQNRFVVALNPDVLFASGDGTQENPYTLR